MRARAYPAPVNHSINAKRDATTHKGNVQDGPHDIVQLPPLIRERAAAAKQRRATVVSHSFRSHHDVAKGTLQDD